MAPGLLKTAFTRFDPMAADPKDSAEVVFKLMKDEKETYEEGHTGSLWKVR